MDGSCVSGLWVKLSWVDVVPWQPNKQCAWPRSLTQPLVSWTHLPWVVSAWSAGHAPQLLVWKMTFVEASREGVTSCTPSCYKTWCMHAPIFSIHQYPPLVCKILVLFSMLLHLERIFFFRLATQKLLLHPFQFSFPIFLSRLDSTSSTE